MSPRYRTGSTVNHSSDPPSRTCSKCRSPLTARSDRCCGAHRRNRRRRSASFSGTAVRGGAIAVRALLPGRRRFERWTALPMGRGRQPTHHPGDDGYRGCQGHLRPKLGVGQGMLFRLRAPSRRSNRVAPAATSASSDRTVPRPFQNRNAATSLATLSPGGVSRKASASVPRRTGTTSALDPCQGSPAISSRQLRHWLSTNSGSCVSQFWPSCHQRGIARKVDGIMITSPR